MEEEGKVEGSVKKGQGGWSKGGGAPVTAQ